MFSTRNTSSTGTSSNFEAIFNAALAKYTRQTGKDLLSHPLASTIDRCNSPESILAIFQEQAQAFDDFRNGDPQLIKWLVPLVNNLHALCTRAAIFTSASFVFPPAKAVFSGVGVLLSTAKYVRASYDALVDVFECIENFLRRLMIYTDPKITPTPAMADILIKIMVEILSVLALATKQINQGRFKKYAKKLLGEKDIESVLQRLDRLTLEESRTTVAQTFEVIHGLVNGMQVVMDDGKASTDDIRQTLVLMQELATQVKKIERDRLQEKFCRWLSVPDPWINHNIARKAHHHGTSAWFTQGDTLREWKSTGSLLWIHGIPGSGKSILCSTVIEDVQIMCQTGLATLSFFYFDFRDGGKQDVRSLLSSLLMQLCNRSDNFCAILSDLYSAHDRGSRQPSDDALLECLKDMLELPGQGALYLIIDALDECPNFSGYPTPREQALSIIEDLIGLHLPHVHFCITSRPEMDIRETLEPLATYKVSLHEQAGQNQDIADYINSVVPSDPRMRRWREEDKELVIKTLTKRAGGMFRWVHCQVETLRRCFPPSIRNVLDGLPATLDGTYEKALLGIDKEKWDYAYRLFQCLVVSIRPLRVEELAELFTVQPSTESIPRFNACWRPENAEEFVLSACSTLVAVVNVHGNKVVQFSHFSVREYLTSSRIANSEHVSHFHIIQRPAHSLLAGACLSVLLQLHNRINKTTIRNFPLALYAAEHWVDHAQFEDVSVDIQDGMERLFDRDKPHFAAWIWVYDIDKYSPGYTHNPKLPDASPLYYAALCGFRDVAERLIDKHPQDVNARGGVHVTPLHAAADTRHLNIVLLLLERGADVGSRDLWSVTPLHIASHHGYADIVQSLIAYGAEPNTEKIDRETPLFVASREGRLEAARVLLGHGSDANHSGISAWTPLHISAENGHEHVVRLLLEYGANPNAQTSNASTPLHIASFQGKIAVVMVLLEYGVYVDARDSEEETPLHDAAKEGHLEVVQLLLDHGADVNAKNEERCTAWHLAVDNGHFQVVELLRKHSEDPPEEARYAGTMELDTPGLLY